MSVFTKAWSYAKANPAIVIGGVVVVGGVWYLLSQSGSNSSSQGQVAQANATATSAYYAAESAQGTAGDQLQATMIAAQASTAQAQIAANESVTNNTTWANTDLAQTLSNNQTTQQIAPVVTAAQTSQALISGLTQVAMLPPTTTTSSKSDGGFLGTGLFAGTNTTTTVTANPAATSAAQELSNLEANFHAMTG